jgi:hypothetical protein
VGRKVTGLIIHQNKIAGLPEMENFWETGFFKPVFLLLVTW